MTQAHHIAETNTNSWPIDTPERILTAMAGSNESGAVQVAVKSGLALPIVVEWLTDRVQQGLLIYRDSNATYCTRCDLPAIATAVHLAS